MTLMCIDRSQSETHKANVLQGRKSSVTSNSQPRRNSCSPPLAKTMCLTQPQQQQDSAAKNASNNAKLERSNSEPIADRKVQQSTNSSRYKTELCRPFEENGTCKYGDKCQFAHGEKELRSMARHPKYKTELCRTFHSTGLCPYGPRCHFIHNSEQTKKKLLTNLACNSAPIAPVGRPKALTSLGSAGDLSPPSSNENTPTGTDKNFDFVQQHPLSPPIRNNVFFPQEYSNFFPRIYDPTHDFNPDIFDSVSVEKMLAASENADSFNCDNGPVLNLYSTAPLTPSTPLENNYNNNFFQLKKCIF